jgi:poly-gamma-glutamate synthesis protein (capsule biosynthesis protein)
LRFFAVPLVKAAGMRYNEGENGKGRLFMKTLFVGDVFPTKRNAALFAAGELEALFGDTASLFEGNDLNMINLECALTEADTPIQKIGPNLKAPPATANILKELGVTVAGISNNHVFDFGIEGLTDTLAALDSAGLPYFGIGENDTDSRRPYFFMADGKRIAIINVCEHEYTYALPDRMGANPFDPFLTMQDIRAAKAESDFLIVLYHGGKEYSGYPSPRLRNLCREMVYCGADAVITQHSHCIGCYEKFEGAHILYGQGNFNFSYPAFNARRECWKTALLVVLTVTDKIDIDFIPIFDTGCGCEVAEGERAEKILSEFEARNGELADGRWLDGWERFCHGEFEAIYLNAARCAFDDEMKEERFAHYLDCEAHTDVWRTLFKTWNHTNEM